MVSKLKMRKNYLKEMSKFALLGLAVPMCGSARLTLALEGTFGFFVLYLLRVHFSVALVCMTSSSTSAGDVTR